MITVHHLNNSRSQRVLWLLEELGIDYAIAPYVRDRETLQAPATLRKVHPLGRAPTVVDGDRTMAESGAILEHLADTYGPGRLAPALGAPERFRYSYWMHYAEGSLMPSIVLRLIFARMPRQPMPALARPVIRTLSKNVIDSFVQPQISEQLDYVERELATSTWFAGETFTAADVHMSFPLQIASSGGWLDARHARIKAYLQRSHERPAYVRAIARGGPYDLTTLAG